MRVLVVAAALYLLAPGHPDVILSGVPLGQAGAFLFIIILVCWAWTRDVPSRINPALVRAIGVAIAVKFAIALLVPHSGWLAAYYANDQLQPPARRSVEFSIPQATRIDRQVSFVDTEFPVHFFNEHGFNYGFRREATEAFSVLWRGYLHAAEPLNLRHEARGDVRVSVDGTPSTANPIAVPAGNHTIEIEYRKAKEIEGAVHVRPLDASGAVRDWHIGEITPAPASPAQRSAARWLVFLQWLAHLAAAMLVAIGIAPVIAEKLRRLRSLSVIDAATQLVMPAVVLGLSLQGLWKSRHLVGHVFTLTGGDDWLAFEMNARDILFNGWLLPRGAVPGKGPPYFEYPGYGYFVAGVHWLTGDSLAGVILINFVCLAIATVLVHAMARRLVGQHAALMAVLLLLAVEQMDFVRYYTVTLLSENLFFLLVALSLYWFVRFIQTGTWWTLIGGAAAGGLAAATRPTMLLFLPVALILLPLARFKIDGLARAAAIPVVVLIFWFAAISPFTYRNYVMSGKPVLITEGQARTFIDYNLVEGQHAANQKYLEDFRNSNLSAAIILLRILRDFPAETLQNWGTKAGFGFGMVHWMGAANRPHPELIITSALYLLALLLLRESRTIAALLVHGFVFTHLATLLLTMPANYGYRMVLSMYLFMVIFAGALLAKPFGRWLDRRASATAAA
ncbi:MAG TPA: glycosyltransferase family 39 protein [Vicinamibacterales bacterium]